jgi:ABC-type transporter MlaC component
LLAAGLAGICLLLAATPVSAGPATEHLRTFFGQVNAVLNDPATRSQPLEKVARIKRLVTEIADVRGAAVAALEREWDVRTPAERDEFTWLFAELLERGLVARLAGTVSPVNGMVMSWVGETRVGDEARVMTVVEARDGRKINVEYRMIERRGRWLVRDVVVDGVSTVDNYRSQFKRLLRQGSYPDLVKQLRLKLGEETLMFAQAAPPTTWIPASKPPETIAAVRVMPPRVATRAPAPTQAKAVAPPRVVTAPPAVAKAPVASTLLAVTKPPVVSAPAIASTPPAAATPPVASTPPAVATPPVVARSVDGPAIKATTPSSVKTPSTVAPPARVASAIAVSPPAKAQRAAIAPEVPLAADVLSPVSVIDVTTHLLPSILLIMLGFGGVSGAVFLRRRESANALVVQRLRDGDKRLVLVHPVPRVAKIRESGRKRRVVPPPRNPARHVDNAHGA